MKNNVIKKYVLIGVTIHTLIIKQQRNYFMVAYCNLDDCFKVAKKSQKKFPVYVLKKIYGI